jgi:hypothetical protein
MSEMVDRVAKAIAAEAWGHSLTGESLPWEKIPDVYRDGYRRWAVKAIEAMREPTDKMVFDADTPVGDEGVSPTYADVRTIWRSMINEALK